MLSIRSSADMARALASTIDPDLKHLLSLRRDQLLNDVDGDLGDLVHIVIAEAGDSLAAVEAETGVPFATNFVNGIRFGDPSFTDNFEWVENHGRWGEAAIVLSDDGYGVVLFVPNEPTIDEALLALLRDHA